MPNIFQRIASALTGKSYYSRGQFISLGETIQAPTNRDYLDAFEASFLVHTCVDKIAKKVANTKFKLYRVSGRTGSEKIKEVKDSPLLDLLAQVNPYTTKFTMLELTQIFLELLGNSYWYKVRGERTGKIVELWELRPDWVTVEGDEKTLITNYKYRIPNGDVMDIAPEDIIHFKRVNPKSAFYGLPTIKAAIDLVRTSIFATRWNMNFFYNSAVPETLLITEMQMTPEQKKEFRDQWDDKYAGVRNAHRLGIIDGKIDFKQLSMTMKDMQFDRLDEVTTQHILTAFGVPKPIVGMTTDLNRATAEAAIYAFLSETIEPKVRDLVDTLNEFLVPEFGDDLYLDFVDPTPENREAIVQEYQAGLGGGGNTPWLTMNEVRDWEGLPPVEGGWDIYLPLNLLPSGKVEGKMQGSSLAKIGSMSEKKFKEFKEEKEQQRLREKILPGKRKLKLKMKLQEEMVKFFVDNHNHTKECKHEQLAKVKSMDQDQKKSWWLEHDAMLKNDEKLFKVFTKQLFKNQEVRVQDALQSQFTGKSIVKGKYDLVNWETEKAIFAELSLPVYTDITVRRGKRAATLIGTEFDMTKEVQHSIDLKRFKFAKRVNDTTRAALKDTLKEGIKEGEGMDQLTDRVSQLFKERERWESERIARTEVIDASNSADLEAYKQSGVIEKKEWLADPDACEICLGLAAEGTKELNEEFGGEYEYPPAHPNCRCTILPVVE